MHPVPVDIDEEVPWEKCPNGEVVEEYQHQIMWVTWGGGCVCHGGVIHVSLALMVMFVYHRNHFNPLPQTLEMNCVLVVFRLGRHIPVIDITVMRSLTSHTWPTHGQGI